MHVSPFDHPLLFGLLGDEEAAALFSADAELRAMLGEIVQLVGDGTFAPVVDATFSFDQAAEAHRYIQDRKNFGKVILTP